MAHDDEGAPQKVLGVGDEAIGHMTRLAHAARREEVLILKQSLEVITGGQELAAGGTYGMYPGLWAERHQRRRLTIEWDEVLPSHD